MDHWRFPLQKDGKWVRDDGNSWSASFTGRRSMVRTSSWMTACQRRSLGVLGILPCMACPACRWKIRYCKFASEQDALHETCETFRNNFHQIVGTMDVTWYPWPLMVKLARQFILVFSTFPLNCNLRIILTPNWCNMFLQGKDSSTSSRPNIACGTMIDWRWLIEAASTSFSCYIAGEQEPVGAEQRQPGRLGRLVGTRCRIGWPCAICEFNSSGSVWNRGDNVVLRESARILIYHHLIIIHDPKLHLINVIIHHAQFFIITLHQSFSKIHFSTLPFRQVAHLCNPSAQLKLAMLVRSDSGLPMGNQRRSALRRAELRRRYRDPVEGWKPYVYMGCEATDL